MSISFIVTIGMNRMKNFRLAIILFITGMSFIFNYPAPSYAMDRGGCLTCHRYPGLVKYEKPDKFKVLHITERIDYSSIRKIIRKPRNFSKMKKNCQKPKVRRT